jgi:hypothetical protein
LKYWDQLLDLAFHSVKAGTADDSKMAKAAEEKAVKKAAADKKGGFLKKAKVAK